MIKLVKFKAFCLLIKILSFVINHHSVYFTYKNLHPQQWSTPGVGNIWIFILILLYNFLTSVYVTVDLTKCKFAHRYRALPATLMNIYF